MNLDLICSQTAELAKETGKFLLQEAAGFDLSKIEHKSSNELVSYVDKEAEKKLVAGLRKIFPEAAFITEEGTVEKENKEYKWVIDPLDGTTNFLHKLSPFAVSIGLLKNEEVILGVIYEANLGECFTAIKGKGAFCNGKKIEVAKTDMLEQSLIATGFPYSLKNKAPQYFEIIRSFVETTHGVRRMGSAAVDLAYVACGRFNGYFEFNLKIWDIAAGILIVQEAGGKVTDYDGGNDYLYGKELLAAGPIHSKMLEMIRKKW